VYKVVLDTNVLISAIVFGGKPREVFELILMEKVNLAISREILNEMRGVLSGRKFRYPQQVLHSILHSLENLAEFVVPQKPVKIIKDDPADNRILECALEAGAHIIISGDRHLLDVKRYRGIKIISPSDFLERF
jgi:putative PIN family toxin of toxin-antitoxin system